MTYPCICICVCIYSSIWVSSTIASLCPICLLNADTGVQQKGRSRGVGKEEQPEALAPFVHQLRRLQTDANCSCHTVPAPVSLSPCGKLQHAKLEIKLKAVGVAGVELLFKVLTVVIRRKINRTDTACCVPRHTWRTPFPRLPPHGFFANELQLTVYAISTLYRMLCMCSGMPHVSQVRTQGMRSCLWPYLFAFKT